MSKEFQNKYIERKNNADKERKRLERKSTIIANIRMVVFLFIAYLFFKGFDGENSTINFLIIFSLVGFIGLIMWHNRVKDGIKFQEMKMEVSDRHIMRIEDRWREFEDMGEEFQDSTHSYIKDLDIFGKNSLFQLLNRTNTHQGRERFQDNLKYQDFSIEEIEKRAEGIEELRTLIDFTDDFETIGRLNSKDMKDPEKLLEYAKRETGLIPSGFKIFIKLFPIIVLMGLISISFTKTFAIPAIILFVIQIIVWIVGVVKNDDALSIVNYMRFNLITYSEMLKLIEAEDFKSEYLINIKETMFHDTSSSVEAIKRLSKITGLVNLRVQGILNVLLNAFLLWDYQCVSMMEDWKKKYGSEVRGWLFGIGEIESLSSFSELGNITEGTGFAKIVEGNNIFRAKDLGHPLISDQTRINNDIEFDKEILIITGSNMSGKTTFLRTIGINLILAYNGARTISESLEASKMEIYTSMRVVDDLGSGISTFYAEILRIKEIIDHSNENLIFLIDEIFRGTNSADRILGAKNVIRILKDSGAIGAISTHDLELSNLEDGVRIKNYHFSDIYDGETISFDYKIKKGRSTATNAKNLMKLAGIPIVDE